MTTQFPQGESAAPMADFFRALEVERTQALVRQDVAVAERLHAPDYQLITPSGVTFTRERYLSMVAAAPFYANWDVGEINIRQSESMAIVRYRARIEFPSGRVMNCWHTDSYELRDGRWLAVWSQATEIVPRD